jgi:hypothetical protein
VGSSDDGGLGDGLVVHERRLDLHGAQTVPGDVEDVVEAALDPEVPVLVDEGGVAGVVGGLVPPGPVLVDEPLVAAPEGPEHPGPGPGEGQAAALAGGHGVTGLVEDGGLDPGEGSDGAPGLGLGDPREGGDHHVAGLGLPPGVDDGAAAAADVLVVLDCRTYFE